jgi:hypothetical protein
LNVPAVEALQIEMCESVSDVPPLVQVDAIDVIAFDPAEAAAIVACTRAVDPTEPAVAPADPGSAVCSLMKQLAVAKVVSRKLLTAAAASPTVMIVLLL